MDASVGSFDGVDARPDTPVRREFDSRTLHPQKLRNRKNGDRLVWYQAVRHRGRSSSGPRHFLKSPTITRRALGLIRFSRPSTLLRYARDDKLKRRCLTFWLHFTLTG